MSELKFKCTLKSDVILNVNSATEGNKETLDFIPGNNFLGIVAGKLYDSLTPQESLVIFHSGKVRFGDAHPAIDSMRTLKVPASMFHPKLIKASELCYIHHLYDRNKDHADNGFPYQLKQCRNGFFAFKDRKGYEAKIEKSFAIKSAYDRNNRRSKDESMYGYESLNEGYEYFFSIETSDNQYDDLIRSSIIGYKHIGRSRTAQYGLVNITEVEDYQEVPSTKNIIEIGGKKCVTVYADGRLIFLDENGLPFFTPKPSDLGINDSGSKILWDKSQIRTFQYAPWNFKRQSFDTDRCGIEKGSVFVVQCSNSPTQSQYVGYYNNEGFGKVIYNPEFLQGDVNENGKAVYTLEETDKKEEAKQPQTLEGSALLNYISKQKEQSKKDDWIYKNVNDFIKDHSDKFKEESFASQWGSIREYAIRCKTKDELKTKLFEKTINRNGKEIPYAFLTHGVAKDKWEERGRKKAFHDFFYEDLCGNDKLSDRDIKFALINLASEMAKKCRRKETTK